jgi:drug/metabolite transporter (DMT)-like permease
VNRVGVLRCLTAALLFGASAPAASVLAEDVPALQLAGLLYLGAGAAVAPVVARARPDRAAVRGALPSLSVAVVAGGAVGPVLLMAGLAQVDAATASILLNLELVATVALAATLFREHLGGRVLTGAALVAAGGVVLVWDPDASWSAGGLLVAGACLCWGLDNGVTARLDQLSPETVVLAKGAVAGTVNLVLGLALAGSGGATHGPGQVLAALAVGAAGYGASITLWVKGARDLGAARGQVIFATAPFIGAGLAWVALGEAITTAQVTAAVLAAAGVALSLESAHDHDHRHAPTSHDHEHTHPDRHHDHEHDHGLVGRHSHPHLHGNLVHCHPHVPDLHHRHPHDHR